MHRCDRVPDEMTKMIHCVRCYSSSTCSSLYLLLKLWYNIVVCTHIEYLGYKAFLVDLCQPKALLATLATLCSHHGQMVLGGGGMGGAGAGG